VLPIEILLETGSRTPPDEWGAEKGPCESDLAGGRALDLISRRKKGSKITEFWGANERGFRGTLLEGEDLSRGAAAFPLPVGRRGFSERAFPIIGAREAVRAYLVSRQYANEVQSEGRAVWRWDWDRGWLNFCWRKRREAMNPGVQQLGTL